MAVQNSYGGRAAAWPGQMERTGWLIVDNMVVEGDGAVQYGTVVSQGPLRDHCVCYRHHRAFLGIAVGPGGKGQPEGEYRSGDRASVMVQGEAWVTPADEVKDEDIKVYVVPQTGQLTPVGEGNDLVPGARWVSNTRPGNVARVRLLGGAS